MNITKILEQKIEEMERIKAKEEEKRKAIDSSLLTISDFEKRLNNEDFNDYDFSDLSYLINIEGYTIKQLRLFLEDIKAVFSVRKMVKAEKNEIPLDKSQMTVLNMILKQLKEKKETLVSSNNQIVDDSKIKCLKDFKKILTNKTGIITDEMLYTFFEVIDLVNLPNEKSIPIINELYSIYEPVLLSDDEITIEQVIDVYKKYSEGYMVNKYLKIINDKDFSEEILNNIDLNNTERILKFFREKGILQKFEPLALVKISIYGDVDYIENVAYPEIQKQDEEHKSFYFTSSCASLWIKNGKKEFTIKESSNSKKDSRKRPLYSDCFSTSLDEFESNTQFLVENKELFGSSEEELGLSYLKTRLLPPAVLRKRIAMCKAFKIGNLSSVSLGVMASPNFENKIHLSIELGLFSAPMSDYFVKIDKNLSGKTGEDSIRNYFRKYCSKLGISNHTLAYLTYKLQENGFEKFYEGFFTNPNNGTSMDFGLNIEERKLVRNNTKMKSLIKETFATDSYLELVPKFDEYDIVISEYSPSESQINELENGYYDKSILADPLIQKLEQIGRIFVRDKDKEKPDEYVYMFGNRIISRYKVLYNATVLKSVYHELTSDMLLASIIRNSFLSENEVLQIKNAIKKGLTK